MPSNFNNTTPAPPSGGVNVIFQTDGNGNDSAYLPSSALGLPGGLNGDIQYNNNGVFGGSDATISAAGSIQIPEGQIIEWTSAGGYGYSDYTNAAISQLASNTLAFGDGAPGDVSGAAAMTALILFGSSSYGSYDLFHTTIYSGAEQNWSLILPPNPGTAGQVLTTNGVSGVTYWSTVSGGGGSGTVSSFSSGNLSPLFTTSVATSTTTPVLSFIMNTQSANLVFAGPSTGAAATPTFRALVTADLPAGTTPTPGGSSGDIQYNNAGAFGGSLATITAAGSITLPDTQVLKWGGSAYSGVGLSQLAADTLAVGNGNESDVSGAMAMTALILYGSSYYSAYDAFQTTILSGATTDWALVLPETSGNAGQVLVNIGSGFTAWESLTTLGVPWSSLTGALGALAISNGANNTTFNQTTAATWAWLNTTTATALTTNGSPTHQFGAQYWTGSASAADLWTIGSTLAAGSNGVPNLTITHSGSTGTAQIKAPNVLGIYGWAGGTGGVGPSGGGANQVGLVSGGLEVVRVQSGSMQIAGAAGALGFGTTIGTADGAISRAGAGYLAIGTGAGGSLAGNLGLNRINVMGADGAGQATITAAATSVTVNFAANYTGAAAPVVVVTPTSDPLAAGIPVGYWVVVNGSTTAWTGFTINIQSALAGNVIFNYIVVGKA